MARISGKQDDGNHLVRVGRVIRSERKALDMSQEALADAAGLDRSHMGKIERGERNVTLMNLIRIAGAMNKSVSDILCSAGL